MKQWESDAESAVIEQLDKRMETINARRDYYTGLKDSGLIPWERNQEISQHIVSVAHSIEEGLLISTAIAKAVPQAGSPFAITYGGIQMGSSISASAQATAAGAKISQAVANSASIEATFARRKQEWDHQIKHADLELAEIEKQRIAAEIRLKITERSFDLHQKNIEQTEEIFDFYAEKFSNLALYEWLSATLQRLHREAYNSAYSMAKLAELAYRVERNEEPPVTFSSGYWDASRAGLLAGERLLIDLQNLERHFLETNYREMEIDQSFSLAQFDPVALINLREAGTCIFDIPEIFFDLYYPGQYRRRIKAVRLTIPSVVGPYVNVSATLTLTGSQIRIDPKLDSNLEMVQVSRVVSIATSKAQNDAGVFEFNFHDERYMPFETAGAISSWSLSLPKNFRQFDYQTISDVILHISYTALEDGQFRNDVEGFLGFFESSIYSELKKSEKPLVRILSLRHDFPDKYHQLINNTKGTPVTIEISPLHFPFFLKGLLSNIKIKNVFLILRNAEKQTINNLKLAINALSLEQSSFSTENTLGIENPSTIFHFADVSGAFTVPLLGKHIFSITSGGDLAPDSPGVSDISAIDPKKLNDILIFTTFNLE
jgi:hypothetical protein